MDKYERYVIARWAYGHGFDFINDNEYNALHEEMLNDPEHREFALTSWSNDPCPTSILVKNGFSNWIDDTFKLGQFAESIRSVTSVEELSDILGRYNEGDIVKLSYKIDGWNIESHYYNGDFIGSNTRGRSRDSKDVTPCMLKIIPNKIDIMGKVKVTGELSILNSKWNSYKELIDGSNQRNSVSTAIANNNYEVLSYRAFDIVSEQKNINDTYKELERLGFKTPYYELIKLGPVDKRLSQIKSTFNSMYEYLQLFDHKTDGIVLESPQHQIALRIWQWSESDYRSIITGYTETYGRHKTNIVLDIEPVEINGSKVSHLNVNNISNIVDYDLDIGNIVVFGMRSAAIPDIDFTKSYEVNHLK